MSKKNNIDVNKKISMMLVGLFLSLDSEEKGSTEHFCDCVSYDEIVDVLSELGETEILDKVKKYRDDWDESDDSDEQDELFNKLYDELSDYSYPNGRWNERW